MKKFVRQLVFTTFACLLFCGTGLTAEAQEENRIKDGIYISGMDAGGMTAAEAEAAVEEYVENLQDTTITLLTSGGNEVVVTPADMGMTWENPQVVQEVADIGQEGNVIVRYKIMKDLQHDNVHKDLVFSFDEELIRAILEQDCASYDSEAINAALSRAEGEFAVQEGVSGYTLDVDASFAMLTDYMVNDWTKEPVTIELVVMEEKPLGDAEQLAQVTDVLGTFTTSYSSSGTARSANVANGCRLIDGITLYPGEEFSTLAAITPFSQENGYYMAASYLNGKVVDSLGGGICQVSSTLYNAVLLAELDVTQRYNHSMIVGYVSASADAAIAESANKDFKFVNNTDYPIYIEGITQNKKITVTIYGKETRSSDREVIYKSEVLEVINPPTDVIYVDESQPIGYIVTESAHIGYKARLWKIVKENGVEVERTQVNSSNYKATPRYATVGVATADPVAKNEIMAAISTSNIDHVKNVIAILTAPPAQ